MGRIEELVGAPESGLYRHSEHGNHGEHGLYATWENFKIFTTAHGVPHIHHARGTGKRCLWILITIGCLTGFSYNTYCIGNRFFSYQVSTSLSMDYQSSLIFPAVTICNNNPVRKSLVVEDSTLNDLINNADTTTSSDDSSTKSAKTTINTSTGTTGVRTSSPTTTNAGR